MNNTRFIKGYITEAMDTVDMTLPDRHLNTRELITIRILIRKALTELIDEIHYTISSVE